MAFGLATPAGVVEPAAAPTTPASSSSLRIGRWRVLGSVAAVLSPTIGIFLLRVPILILVATAIVVAAVVHHRLVVEMLENPLHGNLAFLLDAFDQEVGVVHQLGPLRQRPLHKARELWICSGYAGACTPANHNACSVPFMAITPAIES
eukprot:COSAG05_NODE_1340_length_5141_cov_2.211226_3_plen_149_part_00